jgi:hypothetical protein
MESLVPMINQWNDLCVEEYEEGWKLMVLDFPQPVGYIPCAFVDLSQDLGKWEAVFHVDEPAKIMHLKAERGLYEAESVALINERLDHFCFIVRQVTGLKAGLGHWLESKLAGKPTDYHPIMLPPHGPQGLRVPSPIRGVLGILTAGIHVNVYTSDNVGTVAGLWVSERLRNRVYGGKYDQIIAGGMEPGDLQCPWLTFRHEAEEEAKFICENYSKKVWRGEGRTGQLRPVRELGTIDLASTIYFCTKKDVQAGAVEACHIEPGVLFCFDLKLDNDVTPEPNEEDNSNKDTRWLNVRQIKQSLAEGMWKPNCGLVTVDFLRRHGLLDTDQEHREASALLKPAFHLPEPIFDTNHCTPLSRRHEA